MSNNLKNFLNSDEASEIEILALLSSAAVLRKYKLLRMILRHCKERKIKRKKIYEALLQTYLFSGFPSALISLQIFNEFYHSKEGKETFKKGFYDSGIITCKKIYGDKFEKLKSNIKSFSPEMSQWFIEEGYGKVLSRAGLSLKERELCIVSILSSLKYESQLYSHINGAFRQKASFEIIKKIITNLEIAGNKSSADFGIMLLSRFKDKSL